MQNTRIRLILLAAVCLPLAAPASVSFRDQQWKFPRVRTAAKEKDETLKQLLGSNGLSYPPKAILLRAFKKEGELELWVENSKGTYILAKKYSICATSGILGPKRRFGDEQVPEGFYELDWFNPQSNFYLSLHVSYPNAADRILGSKQNLGGDIFLHGNCVTIGCIPITDDGIKEIYWLAVLARHSGQMHIPIEIFPTRLTTAGLDQLASAHRNQSELLGFWMNLKEGFDCFEAHHQPPIVRVDRGGRYVFSVKGTPGADRPICYDDLMKKILFAAAACFVLVGSSDAQNANGTLDFTARVTPTAAKPEPVRDFTFYVLTKSYDDIVKEIDERDGPPAREKFIDGLKISPELRAWLHNHDVIDLTLPGVDKLFTPDDVLHVPEFLLAYQRSNSGGVTNGIPVPKYREADKTENPARFEKQHQEYLSALKKFITARPETMAGMELELDGVNPARKWAEVQNTHRRRVQQLAPAEAQTKYLAAKIDTDLDGHASISGLAPGNYWISTLALTASAGDARLRWDVPVKVAAGQTLRIELTNLNATDNLSSK